jgi:hypothetical protein
MMTAFRIQSEISSTNHKLLVENLVNIAAMEFNVHVYIKLW